MDSKSTTLIDHLARGIKNPEKEKRARAMLTDLIEDREEEVSPKRYRVMMSVLWVLAIGTMVLVGVHYEARMLNSSAMEIGPSVSMGVHHPRGFEDLSEKERYLLSIESISDLEQAERLHQMEPDNPAYYMNYAGHYANWYDKLPEGFVETMRRLAPDNSMPIYYAAATLSDSAIEKVVKTGNGGYRYRHRDGVRLKPAMQPAAFDVIDEEAYEQTLQLLEKAASMGEFGFYANHYIEEGLKVCKSKLANKGLAANYTGLSVVYATNTEPMRMRGLMDLFGAAAQRAAEEKDAEQFLKLVKIRDAYLKSASTPEYASMIDALVYQVLAESTALQFARASQELGLEPDAAKFQSQADAFQEMKDQREIRRKKESYRLSPKAGLFAAMNLPLVETRVTKAPGYPEEDLKPMRIAEHEMMHQSLILLSLLLLPLLCLIAFLVRFFFPKAIGRTAAKTSWLLKPADWMWITSGGVVMPLLIYLVAVRLTPVCGHEYGIWATGFAFPSLPLICLMFAFVLSSAWFADWRIGRHLRIKRRAPGLSKPMGLSVGVAVFAPWVAYFAIIPFVHQVDGMNIGLLIYALIGSGSALLATLALGLWCLVRSKTHSRFRIVAALTAVMTCMPVAIIGLAFTLPLHVSGEKHWVAQERMMLPRPGEKDFGIYEGKVARQLYKETNEILDHQ